MKRLLTALVLGLTLWLAAAPVTLAQDDEEAAEVDPAEARAETFEAADEGAQTENISGGMLMITVYAIVWVLLLGYVFSLGFRQARMARELERLRQDLAAAREKASDSGGAPSKKGEPRSPRDSNLEED